MTVHYKQTLLLPFAYEKTFDLCLAALQILPGCTLTSQDRSAGKITAKININWLTWGDIIEFQLDGAEETQTQIKVSSRTAVRTILIDWGQNRHNVEQIVHFLNNEQETLLRASTAPTTSQDVLLRPANQSSATPPDQLLRADNAEDQAVNDPSRGRSADRSATGEIE